MGEIIGLTIEIWIGASIYVNFEVLVPMINEISI
jgi:hypothetical protein